MEYLGVTVAIAWVILLYAAFRLMLAYRRACRRRVGKAGERKVRRFLRRWFPLSQRFHDLYLEHDGALTQIDHIVINDRGLFVLETKNWSGAAIHGSEDSSHWQVFYASGPEVEFANPIEENGWHARMVEGVLGIDPSLVHSVVLMVGSAWFEGDEPDEVMSLWEFRRMVWAMPRGALSREEVRTLSKRLRAARLPTKKWVRRAHLATIRRRRAA